MYIDYFSIAFLVIALSLAISNIYLMFMIQRHLKSELINKSFELLKKELSILEQKQTLHQAQTQLNLKHLQTLEQVLSHIITSSAGFGPGDGTIH